MNDPYLMTRFETKEQYEAWVRARRSRAQWDKALNFAKWMGGATLIIATIIGLLLWANYATAAPLREPTARERGLKEPDAAPQRGVTLEDAKNACEKHGGHWFEEDGGEQLPGHKIIGCLFAVPKGQK